MKRLQAGSSCQFELPSTIEICLRERITSTLAKRLVRDRRFFRELQDQALHDLSTFPYVDALDCSAPLNPDEFIIYASPDMSPLLPHGKCECATCRTRYADTFSRGVCLYADVVVLSDHFSEAILKTPPGEWSPTRFVAWIEILNRLEPLMRGGVIRFARWIYSRCKACGDASRAASEQVAKRLLDDIWNTNGLAYEYGIGDGKIWPEGRRWLSVETPVLTGSEGRLSLRSGLTKTFEKSLLQAERAAWKAGGVHPNFGKKLTKYLSPRLLGELRHLVDGAVFSIAMGRMCNGSLVTDSQLGTRILSHLDTLDHVVGNSPRFEMPEIRELPWIAGLDPTAVMEVRVDAHNALPAFRSLIRSVAFSSPKERPALLAELGAQVIEIEDEFRALKRVKRRASLLAISGLLFSVAGFGTRQPSTILAGLAGFLSTLAAAHGSLTTIELREHGLVHKPAYLLLKAKHAKSVQRHSYSKV